MGTPRRQHFRSVVEIPLRDIVRGVNRASDLSAEILQRALPMAAPELLDRLRASLRSAGPFPVPSLHESFPEARRIAEARAYLNGADGIAPETAARVLGAGVEHCLAREGRTVLFFSETVATFALSRLEACARDGTAAERAARIVIMLAQARAVGSVPGLPVPVPPDMEALRRRVLVAAALWLIAEPPETPTEEPEMLEVCCILARASSAEIGAAGDSEYTLAALLAERAEIV